MNWTEFFAMGGYAVFVWPAYALAFFVLVFNVVAPMRHHKQLRNELRQRQQAAQTRSSGTTASQSGV